MRRHRVLDQLGSRYRHRRYRRSARQPGPRAGVSSHATSWAPSAFLSATITRTPRAARRCCQRARPIPDAPPVTMATSSPESAVIEETSAPLARLAKLSKFRADDCSPPNRAGGRGFPSLTSCRARLIDASPSPMLVKLIPRRASTVLKQLISSIGRHRRLSPLPCLEMPK